MSLAVCSSQAPPPIATMAANGKLRGPNSLRRNSYHFNCLRAFGETMRVMRDGVKDAAAETRPARIVILAGWEAGKCGRPSVNNKCHSRSRWMELALIASAGPGVRVAVSSPCLDLANETEDMPGQVKVSLRVIVEHQRTPLAPCAFIQERQLMGTSDSPRAKKRGSRNYRRDNSPVLAPSSRGSEKPETVRGTTHVKASDHCRHTARTRTILELSNF